LRRGKYMSTERKRRTPAVPHKRRLSLKVFADEKYSIVFSATTGLVFNFNMYAIESFAYRRLEIRRVDGHSTRLDLVKSDKMFECYIMLPY
jgi:hypothetical protein